jgi:hypothetical protein
MRCPTCQTENLEPRKFKPEIGISMAEIARKLGLGTPAIAMAIRKEECVEKN